MQDLHENPKILDITPPVDYSSDEEELYPECLFPGGILPGEEEEQYYDSDSTMVIDWSNMSDLSDNDESFVWED